MRYIGCGSPFPERFGPIGGKRRVPDARRKTDDAEPEDGVSGRPALVRRGDPSGAPVPPSSGGRGRETGRDPVRHGPAERLVRRDARGRGRGAGGGPAGPGGDADGGLVRHPRRLGRGRAPHPHPGKVRRPPGALRGPPGGDHHESGPAERLRRPPRRERGLLLRGRHLPPEHRPVRGTDRHLRGDGRRGPQRPDRAAGRGRGAERPPAGRHDRRPGGPPGLRESGS